VPKLLTTNERENMKDGTYLKLDGYFHRVENESGYWVASKGTTLNNLKDGDFLGVWTDDGGRRYVEETHFFTSFFRALDFAQLMNQRAIWNCANGSEIWLDKVPAKV